MMKIEQYMKIAEGLDNATARASQLHALARVIEDANANPDRDDHAVQTSLWLLSTLLEEHSSKIMELQKQHLSQNKP